MKGNLAHSGFTLASTIMVLANVSAQAPFVLDTTFRTAIQSQYVNSIAVLADGKVLCSGQIKYVGDLNFRGSTRLLPDGSRDLSFTTFIGQGKLTPWNGTYYVGVGQTLRRLMGDGYLDPVFIQMNSGPYFTSFQGGDYHVYPDGRVLVCGAHTVNYPAAGWQGLYNLMWFSNTGYLDTTRTPRKGNGTVTDLAALPDGKFICSSYATQFDGRPCDAIFRVHPDGALDTTFNTGVNWGRASDFLPMADGRVYACGFFTRTQAPNDTLRLVRFMPDGSLDPSFNSPLFGLGAIPDLGLGPSVNHLQPWPDGRVVVTGKFQYVNGQLRKGICVLEADGELTTFFDGCGVGPFTNMGITSATVSGILPDADSTHYYIWGTYTGYDDGVINDPQQRFVTRLHVGDVTTGTSSVSATPVFSLFPNPASGSATLQLDELPRDAQVLVRDALGREVLRQRLGDHYTTIDLQRIGSGVYVVELWNEDMRLSVQKLVVE